MRPSTLFGPILASLLAVVACAPLPPPPPPPPPPGPLPMDDWRPSPPTPTPSRPWSQAITEYDADRLARTDAAWREALAQARRSPRQDALVSLGALIDPRAGRGDVDIGPGEYRCRTVKLGAQAAGGPEFTIYGWFDCRIEATTNGLKFIKVTGSQRPSGLLFPDTARRMVMLGSVALGDDPPASSYGRTPDRDMVAALERIGPERWRLVIPWPQAESNLDLIELVPADQ